MNEDNEKNQDAPEQPGVTPEPQPEPPAVPEAPVEPAPVDVTPQVESPVVEEIPLPEETIEAPAPPAEPMAPPIPPVQPVLTPAPTTSPAQDTTVYITWGWVLVALAFLSCCCGSVFAVPAIILGIIAYTKGDQRGLWIIIAGALALLVGGGSGVLLRQSPNWIPNFRHGLPQIPGGRPV